MTRSQVPLGARTDLDLTPEQLQRLEVLESYDLDYVKDRLLTHGLLPASWVDQAVLEFRRFIGLRVVHGTGIGMISPYVDEVWHQTILFTREYFAFSDAVAGEYLHHEPATGDDPVDDSERPVDGERFLQQFTELYESTFGSLPEFWTLHLSS